MRTNVYGRILATCGGLLLLPVLIGDFARIVREAYLQQGPGEFWFGAVLVAVGVVVMVLLPEKRS